MTILDPHTATSLNESIKRKRKLSWSVTEQVAHQLAHSTQHTHTTSSRYRHNRRHAEWGIHILKPWFWTPFKWFQSGFIIIYTSVLFEARILGLWVGGCDEHTELNAALLCLFLFLLLQSMTTSSCAWLAPAALWILHSPALAILLYPATWKYLFTHTTAAINPGPNIITVFLLLLLLLFLLFSTLS